MREEREGGGGGVMLPATIILCLWGWASMKAIKSIISFSSPQRLKSPAPFVKAYKAAIMVMVPMIINLNTM